LVGRGCRGCCGCEWLCVVVVLVVSFVVVVFVVVVVVVVVCGGCIRGVANCCGVVVSGVVCQQPRPRARPRRRGVVSRPWERSRRALKPLCVVNCLGCCGCRGWCGLRMVLWLSLVLLLLLWSCWRIVVLESLDGVWYRLDGTVSGFWVPSVVKSGG